MPTVKTIEGWYKSECYSWDDYAKPGDLVDESVFEYFLNILPPRSLQRGYLQVGEPHSHELNPKTGRMQATYMTFTKTEEGLYRYCGNCFSGETEELFADEKI